MRTTIIIITAAFLAASFAQAGEPPVLFADKNACMEGPVAQFGRYVGDWKIDDESLAQDGSGWGPGTGARWIFSCVSHGIAVHQCERLRRDCC